MGEYNKYIKKKNQIMNTLNSKRVNKIIIEYLKENNFDIDNYRIIYLVMMIKKMLFNYMMYGEEFSKELLNSNPGYLYNGFEEDKAIEVKDKVNNFLFLNDSSQSVNDFVLSSARTITFKIDSEDSKKHKLQKTS